MKSNGCLGVIIIAIGIWALANNGEKDLGCVGTAIGIGFILGGISCFADTTKIGLGKPGAQGAESDAPSAKVAAASAEVAALTAEAAALSAEIASVSAEIRATAPAEVAPVSAELVVPASVGVLPAVDQSEHQGEKVTEEKDSQTTRLWLIGGFSAATAFFATGGAFHLIRHERGGTVAGPAMWISLVLTIVCVHRFWKAES